MPTHMTILGAALCLPLLLSACSDPDGGAVGTSPTSPAPAGGTAEAASPSASPKFSPGYPVASIYIVTAGPGVTDKDLQDAVGRIAKHPGVESASFVGKHQLRVEMSLVDLVKRGKPVYDDLVKLGTVTTG